MGRLMIKDIDKMTKDEKIEFYEDAMQDMAQLAAKLMAFITHENLTSEYQAFSKLFDEFIESDIDFDDTNCDEKLNEFIKSREFTRDA